MLRAIKLQIRNCGLVVLEILNRVLEGFEIFFHGLLDFISDLREYLRESSVLLKRRLRRFQWYRAYEAEMAKQHSPLFGVFFIASIVVMWEALNLVGSLLGYY